MLNRTTKVGGGTFSAVTLIAFRVNNTGARACAVCGAPRGCARIVWPHPWVPWPTRTNSLRPCARAQTRPAPRAGNAPADPVPVTPGGTSGQRPPPGFNPPPNVVVYDGSQSLPDTSATLNIAAYSYSCTGERVCARVRAHVCARVCQGCRRACRRLHAACPCWAAGSVLWACARLVCVCVNPPRHASCACTCMRPPVARCHARVARLFRLAGAACVPRGRRAVHTVSLARLLARAGCVPAHAVGRRTGQARPRRDPAAARAVLLPTHTHHAG
jgi:hypothetical protein